MSVFPRAVLLATAVVATSAAATLIWQQSEQTSIYTSAAIARHASAPPTFATATDLNNPIFVEAYNVSEPAGAASWAYPDSRQGASFTVAMARHTEGAAANTPVDTVALNFGPPGDTTCTLLAWSSLGSGKPAWKFTRPNCSAYGVAISDDGSTAVVSAGLDIGQPKPAPVVWLFDAQTGAVRWTHGGDDASQFGGPVSISETGAFVAYTRGDDTVLVLDGKTGQPRGEAIDMG